MEDGPDHVEPSVLGRQDRGVFEKGSLPSDGRAARSHRTIEHIIKALLELVESDGHLRPTAHQVARRASVSRRGIYLHFDSVEDIFVVAMDHRMGEVQSSWKDPSPGLSLSNRIEWFCRKWPSIVEKVNPVRRAATIHEPFSLPVAGALNQARRWTRSTVERVFEPELASRKKQEGSPFRTALHFVTSLSAWGDLRHQGVSESEIAAAMRHLLVALLTTARDTSAPEGPATIDLTEQVNGNGHSHRSNERPTPGRVHPDRWTPLMNLGLGVEAMLQSSIVLALLPRGKTLPAGKLAEYHEVPAAFLTKYLQSMTSAGLIEVGQGRVKGGYRLARAPEDITLLDIICAVERTEPGCRYATMRLPRSGATDSQRYPAECSVTAAMRKADQAWRSALAGMTLAGLVNATVDHAVPEIAARSLLWIQRSAR